MSINSSVIVSLEAKSSVEHILWVLKKNWLHFLGTSEMFYVLVELTLLIHDESDA